jgi:hypothetical protein
VPQHSRVKYLNDLVQAHIILSWVIAFDLDVFPLLSFQSSTSQTRIQPYLSVALEESPGRKDSNLRHTVLETAALTLLSYARLCY